MDKAIVACQSTLEVYTCEDSPQQWAATNQPWKYIAYPSLWRSERKFTKAIDSYQKALDIFAELKLYEQWATDK